ncbi:expressed unknown protein [Seminavis robusta]|uniref:Uncharacterized protein n=1 Tax=Seminavis robusta TaxID=568900 RepID=A0A9N8EW99_9STRA|nr:expressed unknown protein [Seminavis robusta]|eukprot:Sro1949_g307300.1 n/a (275) ;mRNA; f:10407-11231
MATISDGKGSSRGSSAPDRPRSSTAGVDGTFPLSGGQSNASNPNFTMPRMQPPAAAYPGYTSWVAAPPLLPVLEPAMPSAAATAWNSWQIQMTRQAQAIHQIQQQVAELQQQILERQQIPINQQGISRQQQQNQRQSNAAPLIQAHGMPLAAAAEAGYMYPPAPYFPADPMMCPMMPPAGMMNPPAYPPHQQMMMMPPPNMNMNLFGPPPQNLPVLPPQHVPSSRSQKPPPAASKPPSHKKPPPPPSPTPPRNAPNKKLLPRSKLLRPWRRRRK